jgi:hypothetical protein
LKAIGPAHGGGCWRCVRLANVGEKMTPKFGAPTPDLRFSRE